MGEAKLREAALETLVGPKRIPLWRHRQLDKTGIAQVDRTLEVRQGLVEITQLRMEQRELNLRESLRLFRRMPECEAHHARATPVGIRAIELVERRRGYAVRSR